VLAALADRPGATAAELAAVAHLGRSTVTKALAQLEVQGKLRRSAGGRDGARRLPDRWDLTAVSERTEPLADPSATPPPEAAVPEAAAASSGRLAKGHLRAMVLEHLRARPGQALSPTAIAKELGRSSGAIANALGRLTEAGEVSEVSTAPRRYALPA
jgi:DNA-binding MarR family transcriptional regulator